jgi:hypothetical protein
VIEPIRRMVATSGRFSASPELATEDVRGLRKPA